MAYFNTPWDYYRTGDTIKEKIKKIDEILDAMLESGLEAALKADVEEYQLNDGQTIIKAIHRNPDQLFNAITSLNKIRNMYSQKVDGHVTRVIDSKVNNC